MRRYSKYFFIVGLLSNTYLIVRAINNFANGIDKGVSLMGIIAYGIGIVLFSSFIFEALKKSKSTNE